MQLIVIVIVNYSLYPKKKIVEISIKILNEAEYFLQLTYFQYLL
jgi:hypothetical protein